MRLYKNAVRVGPKSSPVHTCFLHTPSKFMEDRLPAHSRAMSTRREIVVLASASFFLRFCAFGAFSPYIALWLKHGGHDTAAIGGLFSLYRFVCICSPMAIGALADARKCHRVLFIALTVANAAAVASLTAYPGSVTWQAIGLIAVAMSDSGSLVDAMVVRCLTWAGAASMAPRCRAFGAISWCAVAPLYGEIAARFGLATLYRSYAPLLLIALPFCAALPSTRAYADASCDKAVDPAAAGGRFSQRLRLVGRSNRALCLLLLIFLVGVHFGIGFGFGFVYLESELGATPLQLGFTLTAQALLEVPLFQVAAPLAKALGLRQALLTCQLAACFRFGGWVLVTDPWWILPFESGHGWSFALMYTCSALLAEEFAEVGLQATVLGVAQSAQQAGSLAATLLWTALISALGMRTAFRIAAALFALAALPLALETPAVCRGAPIAWQRGRRVGQNAWQRLVARGCAWRDGRGRLLAAGTVSSSVCSERTSVDRIAAPMVGASQLEDEEPSDEDGDAVASAAAPSAKKKKRKKMNEKGAAAGAAEAAELTTVLDGDDGRNV